MKLLIILFLIFLMNPFAQVITIKGKILDSETEHPLEDANITIKGNDRIGTVSNSQGIFILTADFSPDDILEVVISGMRNIHTLYQVFLHHRALTSLN